MSIMHIKNALGSLRYPALGAFCLGLVFAATAHADTVGDAPPSLHNSQKILVEHPNERIDLFTGQLQLQNVDIEIPGNGGFDIKVERTYESRVADRVEPVGLNWSIHFGRLKAGLVGPNVCATMFNSTYVFELPDGRKQSFYRPDSTIAGIASGISNPPAYISPSLWRLDCISSTSDAGFVVTSPEGMRYEMTSDRGPAPDGAIYIYASRISDRNGNYIQLTYAKTSTNYPLLSAVSAPLDGRRLTFTYSADNLLSAISTNDGRRWQYAYQRQQLAPSAGTSNYFQLTQVTRPDGTSWRYQYHVPTAVYAPTNPAGASAAQVKMVTYPWGGTVTYDFTYASAPGDLFSTYWFRVLKSKTSSDGGTWNFTYAFSRSVGDTDTTTVTAPDKTIVAKHYGYNSVDSTTCWKIGVPISHTVRSGSTVLQSETYTFSSALLSSRYSPFPLHAGGSCFNVSRPLLARMEIVRDGSARHISTYSDFDNYDNPKVVTESGPGNGNRTTNVTYYVNPSKWIVKQTQNENFSGGSTTRTFDTNGNLLSYTKDGVTTSFTFDAQGNVATKTLPRGLQIRYANYKRGLSQQETQPEGITVTRVVDDAGNVTSETNGEGKTTSYTYDGLNRVTSITYPAGNRKSITYTANSKTATRGNLVETVQYDGFGRTTSITLGGIATTFAYDALGRKTFESQPGASIGTRYQYDALNRISRITNADGSSQLHTYGAGTKTVTDERSKVTTYSFRSYGDPAQQFLMDVSTPEPSANISMNRNARDLVTSVTQAGFTRSYGYDSNYYLTSVTNPETGTTRYGRDAAGNMTSRTVGASGTTSYAYDGQNRLTGISYSNNTPAVTQTYTKTHKLKSVVSSTASRSFDYDANGNLTSEALTADGITLTAQYAYNGNDQLSTITYPRSGRVVNYSPDVLGRPTQVSGYVNSVDYWPSGQVKQITYANGTVTSYGQNNRLWPSSFSTQKGAAAYLNSSYLYDGSGNLTSISDTVDSSYNRTLGYDSINRLTGISGPWGAGTIAYNGVGNITSQVLGASSVYYNYDGMNRLSSVTGSRTGSFTYDAHGNISGGFGNVYTYDGAPNLRCANCGTGNQVEYGYDGLNRRVSAAKAGMKSYEMVDTFGNQLVEYTPAAANKLIEYMYLGGKRIAQRVTP